MELGERIRNIMTSKRLTIIELAEKTSLSKSGISKILQNQSSPSINTLEKISKVLNVPLISFFLNSEEQNYKESYDDLYDNYKSFKNRTLDLIKIISILEFNVEETQIMLNNTSFSKSEKGFIYSLEEVKKKLKMLENLFDVTRPHINILKDYFEKI